MSKWHMEYIEVNGERFPYSLEHGDRCVICPDAVIAPGGAEYPFLDMTDAEVAEVLEKLNRAEGEE